MKRLITITVMVLAACAMAQQVVVPGKASVRKADTGYTPIDPVERAAKKAKRAEMEMKSFGGMLPVANSQQGEIVWVNCQKTAPKAWVEEVHTYFMDETKFKITLKDGAFDFAAPKVEGNTTLYIIEDAKLPALLIAPENRWALVNISVIAAEKRPAYFQARVKKQISRAFAILCGATDSQFPGCLTRAIVNEADLDKNIDYALPVDIFGRMRKYMAVLGVKPMKYKPYDAACEEGWAPAPTNDVQKKIWAEVHAIPTKPIKIEFDPKRDAGK